MKLRTLVILAISTVVVIVAYLAVNLVKSSPCDTIFEQTASRLDAKINVITAESGFSIGEEKIQDLTEAAQLTALNLKTCCIVLESKHLDSSKFLQCKNSAREVEDKIDNLGARIDEARKARASGDTATVERKIQQITAAVEDTKAISQSMAEEVRVLHRRVPPDSGNGETAVSEEREPNDDLFTPNPIALNTWVSGTLDEATGADHFAFTTMSTYRDIIDIELRNETTTIQPRILLYGSNKKFLGGSSEYTHRVTRGQDVSYAFSAEPETLYFVRASQLSKASGGYQLRVSPRGAYDSYEPNDDIRSSREIDPRKPLEANFTDSSDVDYYQITAPSADSEITISLENLSPQVEPRIGVYDSNKAWLGGTSEYSHRVTAGQNLSFTFSTRSESVYYIAITTLNSQAGRYRLGFDMP